MTNDIRLVMYRNPSRGGATISRLCIGSNQYLCDVLEDEVREIPGKPVSEWKIKGATAIPAGLYTIEAQQSMRFGLDTLTLLDVPGFKYIRIHGGNTIGDTEGCLLPGIKNSLVTVGQSKVSLARLKSICLPALKAGGKVTLEIIPATGEKP